MIPENKTLLAKNADTGLYLYSVSYGFLLLREREVVASIYIIEGAPKAWSSETAWRLFHSEVRALTALRRVA